MDPKMSQLCHQISRELGANKDSSKLLELMFIYLIVNWNYLVIQRNAVLTNFEDLISGIKNVLITACKTLMDHFLCEELVENKMIEDVMEEEELFRSNKKRKIDKEPVEDDFLQILKDYAKKLRSFENSEKVGQIWVECQELILSLLNLLCSCWIFKGHFENAILVLASCFDPEITLNVDQVKLDPMIKKSLHKAVAISEFLIALCSKALEKENYITHCEKAVQLFPDFLLANYVLGQWYYEQQLMEKSKTCFTKCIEAKSKFLMESMNMLGCIHAVQV